MSEKPVSHKEAQKMADQYSRQALEAILIEREAEIARLQAENERLQEQNKGLLAENQRMHGKLSSIAAERKNRNFWAKY